MKLNSMLSNFFNFEFLFSTLNEFFSSNPANVVTVYQMFENFKFQNVQYPKHLKESMKSA